jgi:hypothetical protein
MRTFLKSFDILLSGFFPGGASHFPAALFLSLAPGFSRVIERQDGLNRFSGLQASKNR